MSKPTKYLLDEKSIPHRWYNIKADLPSPMPQMLHPGTGKPVTAPDMQPLFCDELLKQEMTEER